MLDSLEEIIITSLLFADDMRNRGIYQRKLGEEQRRQR